MSNIEEISKIARREKAKYKLTVGGMMATKIIHLQQSEVQGIIDAMLSMRARLAKAKVSNDGSNPFAVLIEDTYAALAELDHKREAGMSEAQYATVLQALARAAELKQRHRGMGRAA